MEFVVIHHSSFVNFCYFRFCLCLDGLKTGMTVKEEILKEDKRTYQKRPPEWKETDEDRNRFFASGQNEKNLQRPNRLGQFIMDELYEQAKEEKDVWLARIENHFKLEGPNVRDEDLVAPWNRAIELSERLAAEEKNTRMERELDEISKHIESVYEVHRDSFSPKKVSNSPKSIVSFTELPIEERQDKIRKLSKRFVSFPPPGTRKFLMQDEEIARLRASYAYKYDYDKCQSIKSAGTSFPWDVAMRELGAIKARATGGHKTVVGEFYDHFNMKHSRNYNM
jgi:RNA-dependent RNA polymerase